MKPPRFLYYDPAARSEVLALLAAHADDAKVLAGGQSLVPLLNMRLAQPAHLIDINRVTDLAFIRKEQGSLVIGAMTRHRDLERSALVRQHCPLLAEAMPYVGHVPIRSRGTIGGSLAHADPAAELPAVLLALGGHIRAESEGKSRIIPASELFTGQLQTALTSTELLTEVWFPLTPPRTGAALLEVSRRHGDFALVGVTAQITLHKDGTIGAAHLALFGVAETPLRASAIEEDLLNQRPSSALFARAGKQAIIDLHPNTDIHASSTYRKDVTSTLISRALHTATTRAGGKV